jgi:hypothetical protein
MEGRLARIAERRQILAMGSMRVPKTSGRSVLGLGRVVMGTEAGSGGLAIDKAGFLWPAGCVQAGGQVPGLSLPWDARETRHALRFGAPRPVG